jgi:hypothetical protein
MLRRTSSLLLAVVTMVAAFALGTTSAYAGPGESSFTSLANSARSSAGLWRYTVASDLVAVARRQSERMAAKHDIWHNPNLASDVSGWRAVGENVGMGPSVSSIHNAFMNSPAHRSNILDHDFTEVGMGTATDANGTLYITQVFRQPQGARRPTVSAPAPAPAVRSTTTTRSAASQSPARRSSRNLARSAPAAPTAVPVDPMVLLRKRLVSAKAAAARNHRSGAVPSAVTFAEVMSKL